MTADDVVRWAVEQLGKRRRARDRPSEAVLRAIVELLS